MDMKNAITTYFQQDAEKYNKILESINRDYSSYWALAEMTGMNGDKAIENFRKNTNITPHVKNNTVLV